MKKENFFKRHRIALTVIALIVAYVLYQWQPWVDKSPKTKVYYDMETTVQTWDLENVLTLQGTTQFADSQKLTFMTQWKVTAVNVKVWDYVKKGQVLAKISTDDLDNNVAQAQLDIDTQKTNLQDLLDAKNLELEYIQEKANYDALLLQKETIDQDQELAMQELQQKIKDAQKLYDDTLADYNELLSGSDSTNIDLALSSTIRKRNQTLETAVLELKTIINDLNSILDNYDKKLLITDKYKYEVARNNYIWAEDLYLKSQSEWEYYQLTWDLDKLREKYSKLSSKPISDLTSEEVIDAYSTVKSLWNKLVDWWETNYDMFNASITSSDYTLENIEADVKSFGTDLQSLWLKYVQLYTQKVSTLADLDDDTSLEDTKLKLDKAKTNLDKLNMQVDVLKAQQEKDKATLEDNIDTSLRNLNKIAWWESLKETQIKQAQNRLNQLQRNLRNIKDKYDDYELTANFDWVITEMDIQVWDSINPASSNTNPKYIYVESNNILEMTFDVEQIDIIQLKVWMDAEVYLDAYPNEIYHGKISEINTIPNTSSMTTTYPMTVTFEKNDPNETILAGMWWSAKIILSKVEDVLVVPSQAVTTVSWQNMVMLKQWELWIENPVEIWDSDETNTEIISWLKAWDTIKSMFYSNEAMAEMWLSSDSFAIDMSDPEAMRKNADSMRQDALKNMGMWWWNRWWNRWGGGMWWFWWM